MEFCGLLQLCSKIHARAAGSPVKKNVLGQRNRVFFETIAAYKPDIIFAWGERLWNMLPDKGCWGSENIVDEQGGKLYFYKTKDIPAYRVYHPSTSYFNYGCSKYVQRAMEEISKN